MSEPSTIHIIEAGLTEGSVDKKTEKVLCSHTQVQFNLSSATVSTTATYQVSKQSGEILASGTVTIADDGKGVYAIDVADTMRNSTVVVSFSINDSVAGEYTLKIDPVQLNILSVKFTDPEFAGQNIMRVKAGTKVSITVKFKRKVVAGESVRLQYKAYKKDPGKEEDGYKEYINESIPVAAGKDVVEITVEPQESHSGTKIALSFFLRTVVGPTEGTNQGTVRYLDILSEQGRGITHMYWSTVEKIDWEASPTPSRRTEICNNETAFLHIRTRQMYGQRVHVFLYERDCTSLGGDKYLAIQSHEVVINDNVACLAISMREACRALKDERSWEGGDYELFCMLADPINGTYFIHAMEEEEDLLLNHKDIAETPAMSTLDGTKKFVIAAGVEEGSEDSENSCFCKKKHIDLRPNVTYQTQFDPKFGTEKEQQSACCTACKVILTNAGLSSDSAPNDSSIIQIYSQNDSTSTNSQTSYLTANSAKALEGIKYIDEQLEAGYPVLVGVNYKHGSPPNSDKTTDHFIVIVGRGCTDSEAYYIFYEVGTGQIDKDGTLKGTNDKNKLYVKKDNSLQGSPYHENARNYIVVQVRKNKLS